MRNHWKNLIFSLLACGLMFWGSHGLHSKTNHLRVDTVYDATLVNAYEYHDRCGHKGNYECSKFKGRFLIKAEKVYIDRDIDGFFYSNYVGKGRKDMPAWVTASKVDLGAEEPPFTWLWALLTAMSFGLGLVLLVIGPIYCLLTDQDKRNERRNRSIRPQKNW